MFLVLWFVFYQKLGNEISLYPAYLLIGIILFNLFQMTTNESATVFLNNRNLVKSVKFPYISLVVASVVKTLFTHLFEFAILLVVLILMGINLWGIVFYPLILIFYLLFIYGVSLILSVITVYIIDFGNLWRFLIFLLWLATPIFYSSSQSDLSQIINKFNPLYYFISMMRSTVLYGKMPPFIVVLIALSFSLGSFLLGSILFRKLRYNLIEKI